MVLQSFFGMIDDVVRFLWKTCSLAFMFSWWIKIPLLLIIQCKSLIIIFGHLLLF